MAREGVSLSILHDDSAKSQHEFLKLFPERNGTSIWSKDSRVWRPLSQYHYLSDEDLLKSITSSDGPRRGFSIRQCAPYLVLAISVDMLPSFTKCLEQAGIHDTGIYTFEDSDIAYLYIFLDRTYSLDTLRLIFSTWLERQGLKDHAHTIADDEPIPFPLQTGFSWLDSDGEVTAKVSTPLPEHLEQFLLDQKTLQKNPTTLIRLLAASIAALNRESLDHIETSASTTAEYEIQNQRTQEPAQIISDLQTVNSVPKSRRQSKRKKGRNSKRRSQFEQLVLALPSNEVAYKASRSPP